MTCPDAQRKMQNAYFPVDFFKVKRRPVGNLNDIKIVGSVDKENLTCSNYQLPHFIDLFHDSSWVFLHNTNGFCKHILLYH